MYAILDLRGTILRAYHATKPAPGAPIDDDPELGDNRPIVSAANGLTTWLEMYLLPILENYTPKQIIAVLDGGNDYRRGMYANYKANRSSRESSLARKAEVTKVQKLAGNMLASLGVLQMKTAATEADDCIAALCQKLEGSKLIYTVDADLLQLAGEYANGPVAVVRGQDHIEGEYNGIPLNLIRLHKSILGDSSDNYSGVKGLGAVAWDEMVAAYGHDGMEELAACVESRNYSVIEEVLEGGLTSKGAKALQKLYDQRKEWEFYWHLAGLHPSLLFRVDRTNRKVIRPEWHLRLPSRARLEATLLEANAPDYIHRFEQWMPTEVLVTADNLGDELVKLYSALPNTPFVSFDFESSDKLQWEPYQQATTSNNGFVDVLSQELAGCSFNYGPNLQHTMYICFDHRDTANVPKEVLLEIIDRIEKAGTPLVVQNELFERNVIANEFGLEKAEAIQPWFDTAVMASYVDENLPAGLKDSSLHYLKYQQTTYKETIDAAKNKAGDAYLKAIGSSHAELLDLQGQQEELVKRVKELKEQYDAANKAEESLEMPGLLLEEAERTLDEVNTKIKGLSITFNNGRATINLMCDLTGEDVLSYGCDDSFCTAHLAHLYAVVMMLEGTMQLYLEHDQYNAYPLMESFRTGVNVDYDKLSKLEAEDKITYEQSMTRVRELLEINCSTPKPMNPQSYIDDVLDRKRRELIDSGRHGGVKGVPLDREGVEEALTEWKTKLREATVYTPFVKKPKPVDFKPTPTMLGKVIDKLFLQDDPAEPLKAPSATPAGITKWMTKAEAVLSFVAGKEQQGERFMELLCLAAAQMKDRAGAEYEAFAAFCEELLLPDQPTEVYGDELNFNSPKQMTELFYCKLGFPVRDRNKQVPDDKWKRMGFPGTPSTGDKAMEMALVEDCTENDWRREVLLLVRKAKSCLTKQKLYYTPWPLWKSPRDGVMHPSIRPSATTTRRPTGGQPNMLQVSKKDDAKMRTVVIRRTPKEAIISLDFNGQELRIMTSESQDATLLDAYIGPKKRDVHTVTAAKIAPVLFSRRAPAVLNKLYEMLGVQEVPYEVFDDMRKDKPIILGADGFVLPTIGEWDGPALSILATEVRKVAKAVNFLIVYGGNEITLARNLSIAKDLAKAFIDMVLAAYPGIPAWQDRVIDFGRTHGYVETAFGSRRHLTDDILSSDGALRSRMERQAVNFTIQGCAADILKRVMAKTVQTNLWKDTGARLIAPVYDELVASVPVEAAFEYVQRLQGLMNLTPPGHAVPMLAEVSVGGYSWGNQIELGAGPTEDAVMDAILKTNAQIY